MSRSRARSDPRPRRGAHVPARPWLWAAACLVATVLLAGCEKTFENMYDQPKYKPLARSALWADGRASRPPVAGTVPHGEGTLAGTSSGRLGRVAVAPETPWPVPAVARDGAASRPGPDPLERRTWTLALLERGRERYDIFCAPCHSEAGDGDGMVARRGFPHPPSFHVDRLRDAPDAHYHAVITHGYGAMYPYADRVPPGDRRAIVAYIRALQLSQHASLSDAPPEVRRTLQAQR